MPIAAMKSKLTMTVKAQRTGEVASCARTNGVLEVPRLGHLPDVPRSMGKDEAT